MSIVIIILGLLIAFILLILGPGLGINFLASLRLKSIYRYLGECFDFSHPDRMFRQHIPAAAGTVNGTRFTVVSERIDDKDSLRITAHHAAVLPRRLILTGGNYRPIHIPHREASLHLLREEFLAVNMLLGKAVFGRQVTGPLEDLDRVEGGYIVHGEGIDLYLPSRRAGKQGVRQAIEAMANLAGQLHNITAQNNLYVYVLNARARRGARYADDLECLRRLIRDHRTHSLTKETIGWLIKGSDFESGVLAAQARGLDLVEYVRSHFDDLDQSGRVNAVRELADHPTPERIDLLHSLYSSDRSVILLLELIRSFSEFPDERSVSLCIGALDSKAEEIRRAAIGFLGAYGGKQSLPPLYRFYRDTTGRQDDEWCSLHEFAEAAIRRICHRLGVEDVGHLSLSEDADTGGLSLAEGTGEDADD